MYLPTTFPVASLAGTSVAGFPFSSNNVYVVGSIGTFFSTPSIVVFESLNVTGCS